MIIFVLCLGSNGRMLPREIRPLASMMTSVKSDVLFSMLITPASVSETCSCEFDSARIILLFSKDPYKI